MPQIIVTVRDDDGKESQHVFELAAAELSNLDAIDAAVERFKNAALPQLEQQLLTRAQEMALAQEKKTLSEP